MQNNAIPALTPEYRQAAHRKMTAYTAKCLAGASVADLRKALDAAKKRFATMAPLGECDTKEGLLARDRIVAHQIMIELERRGVPVSLEVA